MCRRGRVVVLISCGKRKRSGVRSAVDLYSGSFFVSMLKLALCFAEREDIYILSAKYGLIHSEKQIRAYELHIDKLSRDQKKKWACQVNRKIKRMLDQGNIVLLIAGRSYRQLIQFSLPHLIPILPMGAMATYARTMTKLLTQKRKGFGLCLR